LRRSYFSAGKVGEAAVSQVDKVRNSLGASDERVEAAAIAFPAGGVRSVMKAVGGIMELPLPQRMVVALTDRRLLVYAVGGVVVAKPGKLLSEFARGDVVDLEPLELEGGVATALRVGVVLADGSVLRVEFPRLSVEEGTRIIDALAADLRPSDGASRPPEP
jgi:hypothetical protein